MQKKNKGNNRKSFVMLTVSIHATGIAQLLVCTLCWHLNATSCMYLFIYFIKNIQHVCKFKISKDFLKFNHMNNIKDKALYFV